LEDLLSKRQKEFVFMEETGPLAVHVLVIICKVKEVGGQLTGSRKVVAQIEEKLNQRVSFAGREGRRKINNVPVFMWLFQKYL